MNFKFLGLTAALVVSSALVYGVEAAESPQLQLVRERRDSGGFNVIQLFLKVEELLGNCKTPPSGNNNATNVVIQFVETHNMTCLVSGLFDLYHTMFPAKQSELSRYRRDTRPDFIQIFLGLLSDVQSCKNPNPPPKTNNTILDLLAQYDTGCVVNAVMKVITKLSPHNNQLQLAGIRHKRDTNVIQVFLEVVSGVQHCKKSDPPAKTNNVLLDLMNEYDIGCVMQVVTKAISSLIPPSAPQKTAAYLYNDMLPALNRNKREILNTVDIICIATKVMGEANRVTALIKAFSPPTNRTKRAAPGQKICDDLGTAMDSLITFIGDFAPHQPVH